MASSSIKQYLLYALFGIAMGITLSLGGLSSFEQVHHLFLLQNIPMLGIFGGAIGLSMVGFFLLTKNRNIATKKYNSGTIPGSIMFGVGWAMTGACPSIALVQLGEGKIAALVTIAGIVSGVWIYRKIAAPSFKLDTGVCGE